MKPILFNAVGVDAILKGRKTMTRRVIKKTPKHDDLKPYHWFGTYGLISSNSRVYDFMPPCVPGEILYVRETWCELPVNPDGSDSGYKTKVYYKADGDKRPDGWKDQKWRPSIHMPKEAARIFLRVTDVRVERLRDISEDQAQAEGFYKGWTLSERSSMSSTATQAFMWNWNSLFKPVDRALYGWSENPWVWAIEFDRISKQEAME